MRTYCFLFCIIFTFAFTNGETNPVPLSIDKALDLGLQNNPQLKAVSKKIEATKAQGLTSISLPSPDVTLAHDYIPTGQNIDKFGEKTFGISQSFEFPSNYFIRDAKSQNQIKIAKKEFEQAKLTTACKIKISYFKALALKQQVTIAEQNLTIAQDFMKKADARLSLGEGTHLEKLTAKVQYSEALNTLEMKKNLLLSALTELRFSMGCSTSAACNYNLTDTLGFTGITFHLDTLTKNASLHNPMLAISTLTMRSLSNDKALAWSSILPSFTIGIFSKQVKNDATNYYGTAFGLSVPLWFFMENRGKIGEAAANVAIAEYELQDAQNLVFLKTQNALNELKNAEKQVLLYQSAILPLIGEMYRTALKSYEAGAVTYIEFLSAKQTIIQSKSNYIDALLDYNIAKVTLEESVGRFAPLKGTPQ